MACDCGYAFTTAHDAPLPEEEVRDLRGELRSRRSAGWVVMFGGLGLIALGLLVIPFGVIGLGAIFGGGTVIAGGARAVLTARDRMAALGPEGVPTARLIER